ncbi:MAG: type IV secretory system conjugative DNA transfer family protein [Bacilli bacterium]|nr:type IV secretory system conjugative DNA transfer family protein [Bacilli bacterium]
MKFRVSSKDFVIFVIFCIFLLYLCAIAVLNFSSFANDGTFFGLNPFPAFGGKYLLLTLFMFGVAIAIIFSSVSSYIFEKDKSGDKFLNIGEKDEKGYSRWAKDKEIKSDRGVVHILASDQKVEGAGVPLINNGKELWVDNSDYHTLIIGATGSGKSEAVVKPLVNTLAKKGESMIINDPKGELYKYCGDYLNTQGYNIIVLNFRNPNRGNSWNPLAMPYRYYKEGNKDKAIELLKDIGNNILVDPKNKDSAFWESTAADYFSALALGLFEDGKEEEVNISSIFLMDSVGDQRFGASRYINEYFNMKGENTSEYVFASATINAPGETKGGIQSTFRSKMQKFATQENLAEMLSYSDFDMTSIGEKKTAVFLIIHDEKTTYHSLLTIFLKQCYEVLIDVAQERGGKLKYRTNFILDEFANMPALQDVDSMVSAARSRDIRFTFIIQNFAQLNDVYGKEIAETLKGNCGNLIYLISTEMSALEEISKMCGEVKSKDKDKTASTPLVTVSDLQKMKMWEVIIRRLRMNPYKTKFTPDFKMDWGIERKDFEFPTRETGTLHYFDLKTFVSEAKRKQMMEDSGPGEMTPSFNPFMGGMGMNPFMGPPISPRPSSSNMDMPSLEKPISSLSSDEIDQMIADIDQKLKELDEEEERERKQQEVKEKMELPKLEKEKAENTVIEEKSTIPEVVVEEEKPKIHIDKDSVVMNDNTITNDEFFDDFFS